MKSPDSGMLIYVCQDGVSPSGVASYGYHVLKNIPESRMLLLNASRFPDAAPEELRSRMLLQPEDRSHNPGRVAQALASMIQGGERCVLLPNTGDTPWTAVTELLWGLAPFDLSRFRVLGIIHGDTETQYALAQNYWPIAPLWIGISRRCAEETARRLGSCEAQALQLYCPVEIPRSLPERTLSGPLKIAYVGRLEEAPSKRVSRFVEVLARLRERNVDFRATIAGDGPAADDVRRAVAECRLEPLIEISGSLSRRQIDQVWTSHHVFALTSASEGLPLALLEAMAHGVCPVVMAVESGLPEILVDGQNSRVAPQGDCGRMAEILEELANARETVARLGAAAHNDVATRFSPEAHFAQFRGALELLQKLPAPDPERIRPDETSAFVERLVGQLAKSGRPIVVYGSGMFGRKVVDRCLDLQLTIEAMIDSDPARSGMVYRDVRCYPPCEIPRFSHAAFAIGSLQFVTPIRQRILELLAAFPEPLIFSA